VKRVKRNYKYCKSFRRTINTFNIKYNRFNNYFKRNILTNLPRNFKRNRK
jgi:hypothetical protein